MDAYVVSKYVKKSLLEKNKKIEHADFIMPSENQIGNGKPSNGTTDLSSTDLSTTDLSTTDLSTTTVNITNIDVTNINEGDIEIETDDNYKNANMVSNNTFLLMLIINSYAAYLSWTCNTKNNYPLSLKLVFALFSFMFGSLYVIYYMLFRFDSCNQFNV
jgi:hypothetical protein